MITFIGVMVLTVAGSCFIVYFYQRYTGGKTDFGFRVEGNNGPVFLGAESTNRAYDDAMDVCTELSEVNQS
jgi:hypothetical protein